MASFGALLAFLDATIVNIAFPSMREDFPDESIGTISWVLNAYNIVFASFMIVFGRLSDVMGRRRLYLVGVGLFTLASLACAAAPTVEVLVLARVVQALGAAMLVPASLAVVIDGAPAGKRARAVGLWAAAAAVAAGLGPPIGGMLVEAGGWRWAFWINLPLGILAWWLGRGLLVNSRAPGRRRMPDLRGAVLLAGALGLTTLAIIKGSEWGASSVGLWLVVAGAVVLFAAFVASSMRHPVPVLDLAMMRNRPFLVANIVTLVAGVGFFAYMLTNVLWLQYVWQYSVLDAGLALVPGAIVAAITAGLLEPVAARFGYRWIIAAGFVVWALGYVWYLTVVEVTPDFWLQWLPGQIISGVGVGATLPLLAASTLATQPGGRYATASAVISSARQIGGTIGVALLVVILGTPTALTVVDDLRDGWKLCIASFVAGAVITLFMGRVRPPAVEAGAEPIDPSRLHQPDAGRSVLMRRTLPPVEESLFARLPPAVRERIEQTAPHRTVPAGDWLLQEGDPASSMFVLLAGRAEVVIGGRVVRELGPGAVIGELALLTGGVRSASIRARRDCRVLEVPRTVLDDAIGQDPAALSALVTALAHQLADASPPTAPRASRPSLVAVVGTAASAPAREVATVLQRGLSAHLRVAAIDEPRTPDEIDRAEREHQLVLLVAAGDDEEWAARCAREADTVVLVAAAEDPPDSAPRSPARPELVLVAAAASGAARATRQEWLDAVDPWRFSEVTRADLAGGSVPTGMRGLVDRLAGRSLALVCGGGGARALTHIGILLELEAAGIHVDRVAGTSMGAVIGGLYATGVSAAEVGDAAYREFVRHDVFGDYGLPRTSLIRGRRVQRSLARSYGDWRIEELPRGFRCVSTDLVTRSAVVHRSGPLVDAMRATSRIPVVFTPIVSEGRLLIDGSVLDNLPVDTVTERAEGPIIAVNISAGSRRPPAAPGQPPPPVRIPPLGETMMRTFMINGGDAAGAQRLGAWVVTPHSMGVGFLEFHQFDRLVESGRAAARTLLEQTGGDFSAANR
ncbi:MFS transporter [Microbacterium sp. M3]|uniref:MFS transporter n=3 Tax=Microbacterium arthrosphaerae TaxID=792652 RepID=A0ABU4H0N8_9MICO|nr:MULTISPECIES: MFS transporter [Microbacterium]MDW4572896.1 MFS transporter [Microbacterium arthrosphaerae]MDW7606751.1 MFS transporter [Microbacterium sp. M3]